MADKEYTWQQVQEHRSEKSLWVVVNGKVYDVTKFIDQHPGGGRVLLVSAGQDITYLMETSHTFNRKPWEILKKYEIGRIKGFVDYPDSNPFYNQVKEEVNNYFKKNGLDPKDPIPTLQVAFLLLTTWTIGYYFSASRGALWAAALLGVSRALFGINTMHASSHFAVSHKPWVWRWLDWFVFDILMGGSSMAWNYQHVIGHHQHTNVFKADPDLPVIEEGDMRMVFPFQRWKSIYKAQAFYLPFLYTLLAFKTRVTDAYIMFGDQSNGNILMNFTSQDVILLWITKIFFAWYQFYIPYVYFGLSVGQLLSIYVVMELAAGAWLAYFFQVNHISEEVGYTNQGDDSTTKKEWAVLQIEGTVDYAHNSKLFTFLSGTLNFQTVHHLFPSIAPHYYPQIAPIVKKICDQHKVKYQILPNFHTAIYRHFAELHRMGKLGIASHMHLG
jgi:fatty acid desaturase/predicted heme/steroid binding protein